MTQQNPRGKIETDVPKYGHRVDGLYRLSLKALIYNDSGELLVVKEEDKDWDAPGGGMDHGETYQQALARELYEEIGYEGSFSMQLVGVEEPVYIDSIDCLQVVVGYKVVFDEPYELRVGDDAKAIRYIDADVLGESKDRQTQIIYRFHKKALEL